MRIDVVLNRVQGHIVRALDSPCVGKREPKAGGRVESHERCREQVKVAAAALVPGRDPIPERVGIFTPQSGLGGPFRAELRGKGEVGGADVLTVLETGLGIDSRRACLGLYSRVAGLEKSPLGTSLQPCEI